MEDGFEAEGTRGRRVGQAQSCAVTKALLTAREVLGIISTLQMSKQRGAAQELPKIPAGKWHGLDLNLGVFNYNIHALANTPLYYL